MPSNISFSRSDMQKFIYIYIYVCVCVCECVNYRLKHQSANQWINQSVNIERDLVIIHA